MQKILLISVLTVMLSFTGMMQGYSAPSLYLNPSYDILMVGDSIAIDVFYSGFDGTEVTYISAFDLDLSYNPLVLAFSSLTIGDPWWGDQLDLGGLGINPAGYDGSTPGTVNFYEVSLDAPQDLLDHQRQSFILATVTFNAIGPGTSPLNLSYNTLADVWGVALSPDVSDGRIDVNPSAAIPEPGTLSLFCLGLLGLLGFRKK